MSNLIPQSFIDDLLARVDIVEIVGSRVKLRRTGSNLLGLCPFHAEKSPSFTVSPSKQFFHCFGCGAHGSAIGFIMQYEHLSFIEAVDNLASQAGITVPKVQGYSDKVRFNELYDLMEKTAKFFTQQLPRSQRPINYLKSRGLTGEICKKFGVGYAPNDWDNLSSLYINSPFEKQRLVTCGLLVINNNHTYARFRDRITFPIRDYRGHIVGFGGRTLGNDPAKYLNSPETPIFQKGSELYGLFEARKALNNNLTSIIVVEGYMDVIALSQFGINNVVATLGTAITPKQVQLLLRNTQEIIFCFDGDQAGRGAAWRALENSLPLAREGIQIKFLFLPEKDDPDSLIRKENREAFLARVKSSIPLSDFFFSHLVNSNDLNTLDGRALLAKKAQNYLNKMPFGVFRQLLMNKLSELTHLSVDELKQSDFEDANKKLAPQNVPNNSFNLIPPLQKAIGLLLHNGQLVDFIENTDAMTALNLPHIDIFIKLIMLLKKQPNLTTGAILEYWRETKEGELFAVYASKEPLISGDNLKNEFLGTIQTLTQWERDHKIKDFFQKAATDGLSNEEKLALQKLIQTSKQSES